MTWNFFFLQILYTDLSDNFKRFLIVYILMSGPNYQECRTSHFSWIIDYIRTEPNQRFGSIRCSLLLSYSPSICRFTYLSVPSLSASLCVSFLHTR